MDSARDAAPHNGEHDDGGDSAALAAPALTGARLRAAREALGLTTKDIAARTRITLRHVEAIDRGDLGALPGRTYVMGFVRSYARAVGLPEAELAALARGEIDAVAPRAASRMVHQYDVDDPAKTPSQAVTWLALALVVLALVAGGLLWRNYYAPGADLPALALPEPAPAPLPTAQAPPAPAATPAGAVVFTAQADRIWVKFTDGRGQQLLQKELTLGESYTVPADAVEPRLWTGRPEALTITIGGQAVPPLSNHRGTVRDVPVSAPALLARAVPEVAPAAPASVASEPAPAPRPLKSRPHQTKAADPTVAPTESATPAPAATAPAALR